MYRAVSGVLSGLICLVISGCGPTYWKAQLDATASLQETSVSGQAAAGSPAVAELWKSCNRMTVVYAERVQAVLERRVDEAKGLPGASEALSKAQTAANDARPYMERACLLAKDAAAVLAPPVVTPPALVPVAPPVAPPIPSVVLPAAPLPAPPMGTAPPAVAPSAAVPPVGAVPSPPAPPAMPAAPAVP